MSQRYDVIEVSLTPPHPERLIQADLSADDAEAVVKMAVARRGVENSIFKAVPASNTYRSSR